MSSRGGAAPRSAAPGACRADPGSPCVLRLREVSVGYSGRTVVSGVRFDVHAGQFWFWIGPNGSGKTSLLRVLLGLLPPQGGTIERHPELAARARQGFVPQRTSLGPTLPTTVREFVALGTVGIRLGRGARRERVAWALRRVGLEELARECFAALSGGQRQRVSLARALVRKPSLLLLDEPSEGLDVASQEALLDVLLELQREERITILFVTHELPLAARYATHVALFHRGHVLAGEAAEILRREDLERVFGLPDVLGGRGHAAHPTRGGDQP